MAQAKPRVAGGAERPPTRPRRSAGLDYATIVRDARALDGARVRDARGRELVDFVNDGGAVFLGWADPDVEARVQQGGDPAKLEHEAAQRLGLLFPAAEAVGFRTSFEAALADALMAAKTLTGRDGALFCDDAASSSGDVWGLLDTFSRRSDEIAALVVRPLDAPYVFLTEARRVTRRFDALLIFDERPSALRVHRGGVQGLTGVFPDLTVLGSSLANGRPLGAVAGGREPISAIKTLRPRAAASSLAAACATLERVDADDPSLMLRITGAEIFAEVERRLNQTGAISWLEMAGDPTWSVASVRPRPGLDAGVLETVLAERLYAHGALSLGAHVPSLATHRDDVARLLVAYEAVLPELTAQVQDGVFSRRARSASRGAS
jgi:glutamate-1-semialdehyde 2,1-aminomutase